MNETENALPFQAIASEARRQFSAKRCLHPDASPESCGKIIGAHSVQRAGALRQIVDSSNHVLTFYPTERDKTGCPKIHRRGWKEASVFFGFCDKHDAQTFLALETRPFVGSAEQCFLIAYRAHCHELFQKLAARRANPVVRELGVRGLAQESKDKLRHAYFIVSAGLEKALAVLHERKVAMDRDLLDLEYVQWRRLVIEFEGEISIAGTAAITPNVDFHGNAIQVLHDPLARMQYLYFGIVPSERGGAMVFAWWSKDRAVSRYIDSLQILPTDELPHICAQIMFAYCENTYFSAKWWKSLDPLVRRHVADLATNPNPAYSQLTFLQDSVVSWQIRKVTRG